MIDRANAPASDSRAETYADRIPMLPLVSQFEYVDVTDGRTGVRCFSLSSVDPVSGVMAWAVHIIDSVLIEHRVRVE